MGADVAALLAVRGEDVLSLLFGLLDEEVMTISSQKVLGLDGRLDQFLQASFVYHRYSASQWSDSLNTMTSSS